MDKSGKASVKRATPLVKVLAVFAVLAMMVVGVFAVDGSSVAYAQGDGTGGGSSPGSGGISVGSWTRSCDWFDKGRWEKDANGDYVYDEFGRKVFVPDQGWGDESIQWFYDNIIAVEMGTHFVDAGSPGCPEGTEVHMWEACREAVDNAVENGRHRYALNYAYENGVSYDEAYNVAKRAIKKARIVAVGWMWGPAGYGVYTPNVGPGTDGIYNHDMIWRAGYYPSEVKTHEGDVDKKKETWMKCYDIHGHMRRGDITFDEEGNWSALCDICGEEQDTWQHHVWCEWRRSGGIWYQGGAQFVAIAVCEGEPSGESTGDIMLTKTSRNPKVSGDNLTDTTSNWKTTVGYTPENIVYVVTNSKGKEVGRFILDKHGVGWAAELKNGKTVKKKTGDNYVPYVRVNLSKPSGETFYVQEQTLLADGTTRIEMQGFKCTPTKYEVVVTDKDNYSTTPSKNKAKHVWGENEVLVTGEAIRKDTVSNEVILPTLKVTKLAGKDQTGKDITTGNNCYDLKDAVFEICKSSDFSSSQVYTMVTKSNGKAYDQKTGKDFVELEEGLGTYYVREARAPYQGYKPDASRPPYQQGARYTKTVTFTSFYPESEANKSVEFTDDPLVDPFDFILRKVDKDTGEYMTGAEGAGTLDGAVYEVSFYKGVNETRGSVLATMTPDARARWTTHNNGMIDFVFDAPSSGTWKYHDDIADVNYAPLGTITVREITPPTGYLLDSTTYVTTVTDRDFNHTVFGEIQLYYDQNGKGYENVEEAWTNYVSDNGRLTRVTYSDDSALVGEPDVRGGIELRKCDNDALDTLRAKFVYQGGDLDYQGDASLAGAKFTIKLAAGMKPVKSPFAEDGSPLPEDEWRLVQPGGVVTTITTDANGYAKTGNRDLPYASYLVEELDPSTGYLLPTGWKRTVKVENNNTLHSMTTAGDSLLATGAADEPVQRGGLDLLKVDKDTKYPDPQGDATLQGAEFKIYNVSLHDVYVNGTWYPTYKSTKNNSTKVLDEGSDDKARDYRYIGKYNINLNTATPVATIYTGADFHATLPVTTLPYGTYVIFETKAPTGYLFDQDFKSGVSFTIDYNGEIELFRSPVFIDKAYWDEYWDHKSRP